MYRRKFVKSSLGFSAGLASQIWLPAWAQSGQNNTLYSNTVLAGKSFELGISEIKKEIAGVEAKQVVVNNQLPAPLLRWKEEDEIILKVTNYLEVDSSLHWHGILLPFQMDGVPGVSFPGISPGSSYEYSFPVKQAGTYWYHSHSGLQEQQGLYGPIIIDPIEPDPVGYDREYVIVLSDWSYEDPHKIFSRLKKMSDSYNFQRRTLMDFFTDAREQGLGAAIEDRTLWGAMRMNPTDLSDVTGATYTYLINGHSAVENWTGLFQPGEKIRLRFINASAMTIFNVRIPGLPVTVVQADGLNVKPVETDEFQIGVGETFDVIVNPTEENAYTIYCETNDRSGYARATLAVKEGMSAAVPPMRQRPLLSMKDMGMAMENMAGMDMAEMGIVKNAMPAAEQVSINCMSMNKPEMDHAAMDHSVIPSMEGKEEMTAMRDMEETTAAMTDSNPETSWPDMASMEGYPHNHRLGPGVVNVAMNPSNRLGERPLGLENEPHRVLVYTDLISLQPNPDSRPPQREIELHLTSNMERYMWSFDGLKFSEIKDAITLTEGERVRLTMVNDTMMPHPIHLHGMFFDVVTVENQHKPRKHTIVIKSGERLSVDISADALGEWAFHCHLLYHMHAGMMRTVLVEKRGRA